jgi:hypothetical protein
MESEEGMGAKASNKMEHNMKPVVMKNCEPFVFGPAFAIERRNGALCFFLKFSSANLPP